MFKFNGIILYSGPSAIDGKDIVVIATGLSKTSANPKTGDMIQTWILRSDMHPVEALKTGADESICGNCPHRPNAEGKRTCYVNIMGPVSVYRAYLKGNYPHISDVPKAQVKRLFKGRQVRWGAYGDPAAMPQAVLEGIHALGIDSWTGYTHQWRKPGFEWLKSYVMASCDNLQDYLDATSHGWSTFRVRTQGSERVKGEAQCQGGVKTECGLCTLCNGTSDRQRHVTIEVHGNGAKHFVG